MKLFFALMTSVIFMAVGATAQQAVLGTGAFSSAGAIGGSDTSSGAAVLGLTFGAATQNSAANGNTFAATNGALSFVNSNASQTSGGASAAGALGLAASTANGAGASAGAANGFAGLGITFP